jgi:hypothetical protein
MLSRRPSLAAVSICLILISATFFFVIDSGAVEAGPLLTPCPNGTQHVPDCIDVTMGSATNATNSTVLFDLTDIGAYITLVWGNSTKYAFSALSNVDYQDTSKWNPVFLNYLEPNSTYYYKLTATDPSENTVTKTGSWATGADSMTTFSGTIGDANGTSLPSVVQVRDTCVDPAPKNYAMAYFDAVVDKTYHYSMSQPFYASTINESTARCNGGFLVYFQQNPSYEWADVWNESFVTYAPQVVNFDLPMNYVVQDIPEILEFSNARPGYSTLSYEESITSTTTWTNTISVNGGVSGGALIPAEAGGTYETATTATQSITTQITYTSTNGSLEVFNTYWTSGMVEFNALTRQVTIADVTPYGAELNGEQTNYGVGDWLNATSTAKGVYPLDNWDQLTLTPGESRSENITMTGSNAVSTSVSLSVGFQLEIGGISAQVGLSLGWSTGVSTSYSHALGWEIGVPNGGTTSCFTVYGQGGSASQDTATIIGVWEYSPNSKGSCT